jgi:hypothetical protein
MFYTHSKHKIRAALLYSCRDESGCLFAHDAWITRLAGLRKSIPKERPQKKCLPQAQVPFQDISKRDS